MTSGVADVVRDVVAETAPHELPLVDGLSRLDQDQVIRLLRRRRLRDEQLGFGLTEIVAMVTPVVWIAVDEVSRMGVQATVEGAGNRLRALLRRRRALPATIPALTREQLAAVHERVLRSATDAGLTEPAAQALADRVVTRLALDPDTEAPPDPPTGAAPGPADS